MGLHPGPHWQGEVFEALNTLAKRHSLCYISAFAFYSALVRGSCSLCSSESLGRVGEV